MGAGGMKPARVELELSIGWCRKHPELLVSSIRSFVREYLNWDVSIHTPTASRIILVALPKEGA